MIDTIKQALEVTPEELKQPTILKQKEDVFYLLLNTKANVFSRPFIRNIHAQLDKVQAHEGPATLVTLSTSKLFSGGLDLKVISNLEIQDQKYTTLEFIALLGRVSILPFPTICLVKGGAVAGGCMFAFAHDYVYVADKGKFSTKEAELQMHFPPGMLAVIRKRHPYPHVLRDMIVYAKEFQSTEALEGHLIDGIWKEEEAFEKVRQRAQQISEFGANKENMRKIKGELYKDVAHNCLSLQIAPNSLSYTQFQGFPKL